MIKKKHFNNVKIVYNKNYKINKNKNIKNNNLYNNKNKYYYKNNNKIMIYKYVFKKYKKMKYLPKMILNK